MNRPRRDYHRPQPNAAYDLPREVGFTVRPVPIPSTPELDPYANNGHLRGNSVCGSAQALPPRDERPPLDRRNIHRRRQVAQDAVPVGHAASVHTR